MFDQKRSRFGDHGNSRFIITTEQGGAVGRDDRCSVELIQLRILIDLDDPGQIAVEYDIATRIFGDHLRLDISPGSFRAGIQVRVESDRWHVFFGGW